MALPFALEDFIREWENLRPLMTRHIPPEFSRDEWAYLIAFLERDNLLDAFEVTFGESVEFPRTPVLTLARPRGQIAVWLPNNVSMLGPLILILLSLTGNPIRLKGGTKSEDLTGAFLKFATSHVTSGNLGKFLHDSVQFDVFERNDPRNVEMAATASQRIIFGSDSAAKAIHALPHPLESSGVSFVNRRSEAWIEKSAMSDTVMQDLIKVCAIYGQAGCTSPRRVVLLDGSKNDIIYLRDRLIELWSQVIKRKPEVHVSSANVMARQWAAAVGWNASLASDNAAVFASGSADLPEFSPAMGLMCVAATQDEAMSSLPSNIQTIGHAFSYQQNTKWLHLVARTKTLRLVPIMKMHHFGPVWDGQPFFQQAFEFIPIE